MCERKQDVAEGAEVGRCTKTLHIAEFINNQG